jgi:hypothetical protein
MVVVGVDDEAAASVVDVDVDDAAASAEAAPDGVNWKPASAALEDEEVAAAAALDEGVTAAAALDGEVVTVAAALDELLAAAAALDEVVAADAAVPAIPDALPLAMTVTADPAAEACVCIVVGGALMLPTS